MKKLFAALIATVFVTSVALAEPAGAPVNTLAVGAGIERSANTDHDSYKGNLQWARSMGSGIYIGAQAEIMQDQHSNVLRNLLEANLFYATPTFNGLSLKVGLGIGERLSSNNNFGYYATYGYLNYAVSPSLTINAVQYRYRNAFETSNHFESHQVGTGLTYDINATNAVSAKVYRTWNGEGHRYGDGGALTYLVRF